MSTVAKMFWSVQMEIGGAAVSFHAEYIPAPTLALSPVHIRLSSLPLISRRRLGRAWSRASGRGRHSSLAREA